MVKRTRFAEHENSYANYRFELSDDGVLFMQCHTDGGSLAWDWKAHDDMSDAFADIAGDREIRVLLHTGPGERVAPLSCEIYGATTTSSTARCAR